MMTTYKMFCNHCGKVTDVECDCTAMDNANIQVYSDIDVKFDLSISIKCPICESQTNLLITNYAIEPVVRALACVGCKVWHITDNSIIFDTKRGIKRKVINHIIKTYGWEVELLSAASTFRSKTYVMEFTGNCEVEYDYCKNIDLYKLTAEYIENRMCKHGKRK